MPDESLPVKEFEAGKTIIREGQFGREMYILIRGKVEVSIEGLPVAIIDSRGSYIGEICALLGTRRIATVKTLEPCKFYVIEELSKYFTENPDSGFMMAKTLASRLIDMNRSFVEVKKTLAGLKELVQKASTGDKETIEKLIKNIESNRIHDAMTSQG